MVRIRRYIHLYRPRQWAFRAVLQQQPSFSGTTESDGFFSEERGSELGYIYKIENKINGKVYIGQTKNPRKRWHDHKACGKNGSRKQRNKMYDDMKKYGVDNFRFSIIEECETLSMGDRETYWIMKYDAQNPDNGYNIILGRSQDPRQVAQYDLQGNLIRTYSKKSEAAEAVGAHVTTVEKACSKKTDSALGFMWGYVGDPPPRPYPVKTLRAVCQFAPNGRFIKRYENAKVASAKTGIEYNNISSCAKGESKSAGGFLWTFSGEPLREIPRKIQEGHKNNQYASKSVCQYDKAGNYVATYNSLTEASNTVGISPGVISSVCTGRSLTAAGYVWKYADENEVERVLERRRKREEKRS